MIILITDVQSKTNENIYAATYQVVDGTPSRSDVIHLLTSEIAQCSDITYSLTKKQGRFNTVGRQCVQGEHFNYIEMHEAVS